MPLPSTATAGAPTRPARVPITTTLKALILKCHEPMRTAEALAVVNNAADGTATVKILIGGRLNATTKPGIYEAEAELVVRLDHPVRLGQGRRRATVVGAELLEALQVRRPQEPIAAIRPDPTIPTWGPLHRPVQPTKTPPAHIDVLELSFAHALQAVLPGTDATERQASWRPNLETVAIGQHRPGTPPTLAATNGKLLAVAQIPGYRQTRGTWCPPRTPDNQDEVMIPAIAARALATLIHARNSQSWCPTVRIGRERGNRITIRFDDGTLLRTTTVKAPSFDWHRILDRYPAQHMRRVDAQALRNAFERTANAADARETQAIRNRGHNPRKHYGNPAKRLYVQLGTHSIGLQAIDFDEELCKTGYASDRAEHSPANAPRSPHPQILMVDRDWFGHCIAQARYPQECIDLFNDEYNESMMLTTTQNFFVMATFR